MRITFGKVISANEGHQSICKFSNDVGNALPATWKFQPGCAGTDRDNLGYNAREESDLFLTDSDMTYGMSGSALFDQNGDLLGIGSSIMDRDPRDYDPTRNAIYVKSTNVSRLLEFIKPPLKHQSPALTPPASITGDPSDIRFE